MYDGWSNRETWLVNLWIDNDQGSHEFWQEEAKRTYENSVTDRHNTQGESAVLGLANSLQEYFEEEMPVKDGMWADLTNAALSNVNWQEIAEAQLADYK